MADQLSHAAAVLCPDKGTSAPYPLSQDKGPLGGACCGEWAAGQREPPSLSKLTSSSGGSKLSLPNMSVAHPGSQGAALSAGLQNRRGSGLPHGARMLGCTDWSSRAGWARVASLDTPR